MIDFDYNSDTDSDDDRDILSRIYKGVTGYYEFNQRNIERFRIERKFLFVRQWSAVEEQSFRNLNKPMLTYNKLYDYYRKLIGEQRYNTSNLEVNSLNGLGTEADVTLRADIIRGIEYRSRADIAYQTAFANAVSGGMGFLRLRTDYISPKSFKQDIFIEPEKFSERVGYDPSSVSPTKTDGDYMFRYDYMSETRFKEKYPDVKYPQSFPTAMSPTYFNWGDTKGITICEYYEKEWFNFTLYQLSNGEEITKKEYNKRKKEYNEAQSAQDEVDAMNENGLFMPNGDGIDDDGIASGEQIYEAEEAQAQASQMPPLSVAPQEDPNAPQQPGVQSQVPPDPNMPQSGPPEMPQAPMPPQAPPMMPGVEVMPQIVSKRRSRDYKIMCYKVIFDEVLETYEWPGKEFPFAAVMGDEIVIEGETIITSLVTYATDPQRFLNFLASDACQAAKNNRREQFMATPSNIAGFEQMWINPANQEGTLRYNPDDQTKSPPIPLRPPEIPQTLMLSMQQADKDLRSIIGYPQEMEGNQFGQLSGKAIREMQKAGNTSNLIFFDNLKRAQEQMGRAILSMLPKVYDTERLLTIKGVDGKSKQVTVNKKIAGGMQNDLSKGEFDITISAGANYAAQKEDALKVLMELAQAGGPQMFPLIADIVAKNIDIEDNIELVNRLKTLVPPDVIAKAEGKPPPPPPPPPPPSPEQQIQMAKLQGVQEDIKAKRELNAVKLEQAQIEGESSKIRAYADLQRGGLDYKTAMVESAAKVAAAHADVSDKHFETMKHIHDLHSEGALRQANPDEKQPTP